MLIEAEFEHLGFKCVVVMTDLGHRCGYVAVPYTHSCYGLAYDNEKLYHIEVHGGLTYSNTSDLEYPVRTEEDLWWFGYDCAHMGDGRDYNAMSPRYQRAFSKYPSREIGIVRTKEFCIEQCKKLAVQLFQFKGVLS